jgi:hypothetical protein
MGNLTPSMFAGHDVSCPYGERGDALVAPASSRRICASVTAQKNAAKMAAVQELRGGSTGGTCTCGQMYLSQVQSVVADAPGHFAGTMGLGEKTL